LLLLVFRERAGTYDLESTVAVVAPLALASFSFFATVGRVLPAAAIAEHLDEDDGGPIAAGLCWHSGLLGGCRRIRSRGQRSDRRALHGAREAITDFGRGRAAVALNAFADRGLLLEAEGGKAAIATAVDVADQQRSLHQSGSILILTKSNAAVAAISREVRERRKAAGLITGKEVCFIASTSAGHATEIRLARGDKIRFLARNDDLGVINGTVATVTKVAERQSFVALSDSRIRLEVDVEGRRLVFDPMALADGKGRPRIGWAYASTILGAQGLTVDHAVVYLDPNCNRHGAYVAASRARESTTLVVDAKGIDRRLGSELPIDRQHDELTFPMEQRRVWLAERLSRASPKISTLDVIEGPQALHLLSKRVRDRGRDFSHERRAGDRVCTFALTSVHSNDPQSPLRVVPFRTKPATLENRKVRLAWQCLPVRVDAAARSGNPWRKYLLLALRPQ
jgi:hypothetical protein